MKLLDQLAIEYAGPMSVNVDSYYRQAKLDAYKAGFEKAIKIAAIRGRLAQLERNVVDVEILKLAEEQ